MVPRNNKSINNESTYISNIFHLSPRITYSTPPQRIRTSRQSSPSYIPPPSSLSKELRKHAYLCRTSPKRATTGINLRGPFDSKATRAVTWVLVMEGWSHTLNEERAHSLRRSLEELVLGSQRRETHCSVTREMSHEGCIQNNLAFSETLPGIRKSIDWPC